RESLRISPVFFGLRHVSCDLYVARQDSEVGIGAEYEFNLVAREPVDLIMESFEVPRIDLACNGRTPVTKSAREGTAPVGFPHRYPVFMGIDLHQTVEHAFQIRRWHFLQITDPRPFWILNKGAIFFEVAQRGEIFPVPFSAPLNNCQKSP